MILGKQSLVAPNQGDLEAGHLSSNMTPLTNLDAVLVYSTGIPVVTLALWSHSRRDASV